eukprot:g18539.t1
MLMTPVCVRSLHGPACARAHTLAGRQRGKETDVVDYCVKLWKERDPDLKLYLPMEEAIAYAVRYGMMNLQNEDDRMAASMPALSSKKLAEIPMKFINSLDLPCVDGKVHFRNALLQVLKLLCHRWDPDLIDEIKQFEEMLDAETAEKLKMGKIMQSRQQQHQEGTAAFAPPPAEDHVAAMKIQQIVRDRRGIGMVSVPSTGGPQPGANPAFHDVVRQPFYLNATACREVPTCVAEVTNAYPQRYHAFDYLSQGLLCAILASLSSVEAYLATSELPLVHLGTVPVYSIRYLEWLVDVPLLMILGKDERPGCYEALGPILVTNGYIVVSWCTLFIEDFAVRWAVISHTFLAYAWASERMIQWVKDFWKEAKDVPCRGGRAASVILLIVVFGIYGVIYLLGCSGVISFATEHLGYTFMGFGCKVTLSILFASIRAYQTHQVLARLLGKLRGVSVAFVSLLRGTFDHVVQDMVKYLLQKHPENLLGGECLVEGPRRILLSFCLPRLRKDLLKLKAWVLRHVRALEVFFYLLSIASNALSLAPLAGRPLGRLAGVLFGVGGALGEFGDEAGAGDELRRWVTCLAVASILVLVISQATLRSVWYMALASLTQPLALFFSGFGPSAWKLPGAIGFSRSSSV